MPASPEAFTVSDAADSTPRDEQQRLLQTKIAELERLQQEVDQLRAVTRTPQHIKVRVQMLEVNLTKLQKLGADFAWFTNGVAGNSQTQRPGNDLTMHEASTAAGFVVALKQGDIARMLAEPTVMVTSGQPASMIVGSTIPLPGNDGKPIELLHSGIQLDLVASATGNNQVYLKVRARVSNGNDNQPIVVNGARIPKLDVREFNTAVEMAFGQTAVLSGLVQQRTESRRNAIGLSEGEPIEVGLAVVVTPEFIQPVDLATANRDAGRGTR
jgi:Flp pilus assembly secretin CpaC